MNLVAGTAAAAFSKDCTAAIEAAAKAFEVWERGECDLSDRIPQDSHRKRSERSWKLYKNCCHSFLWGEVYVYRERVIARYNTYPNTV